MLITKEAHSNTNRCYRTPSGIKTLMHESNGEQDPMDENMVAPSDIYAYKLLSLVEEK